MDLIIDLLIESNFAILKFFFKKVRLSNIIEDFSFSKLDNKLFLELNASPFFSLTVEQTIILTVMFSIITSSFIIWVC